MAALPELSSLFANGIGQNGVYLALVMQRIASVKRVVLFVPGGESDCRWIQTTFGIEVRLYTEGLIEVDVLIELGWRVDADSVAALRARGGKFVAYVGGNQFVMNLESVACNLPRAEMLATADFDSLWITPQHWRTNLSYLLLTRNAEACEAPHIWSPIYQFRHLGGGFANVPELRAFVKREARFLATDFLQPPGRSGRYSGP